METLLLPGLDGTGALFDPLLRHLSPELRPRVIGYPEDVPLGYDELLERIPVPDGPFGMVAESFSGPLGIRLAARYGARVSGLVMVASFVRSPSSALRWLRPFLGTLSRVQPPDWALRDFMLGREAPAESVASLRDALARVHPTVLARRLRAVAEIDLTREWQALKLPVTLIVGSRDRLVPRSRSLELERVRPGTRVVTLDAPHLVLQHAPQDAARHIELAAGAGVQG